MSTFNSSRNTMKALRQGVKEDLDAGESLKLGPDFQNTRCLTISEVHFFLQNASDEDRNHQQQQPIPQPNCTIDPQQTFNISKFKEHCSKFNTFTSAAPVVDLRKIIEESITFGTELWEFEIAQIANFMVETPEEIKALVPSLIRFEDEPLQELLDSIKALTTFF